MTSTGILITQNAGINVPAVPLEELSMADYRSLMAVNVDACFYCAQEAIKLMKTQSPKGGRYVY
jgi:NAD(P)-dependent dehydrogenase (short-subunit alcohol dehydrogenase family)